MTQTAYLRYGIGVLLVVMALAALSPAPVMASDPAQIAQVMDCTFTASFPIVLLRDGPGQTFQQTGLLRTGETLRIVGQDVGDDGFVWWLSDQDTYVRSDLGTSDCPATCGNTVCEIGETATTCAQDCSGAATATSGVINPTTGVTLTSTGVGCFMNDSQQCYESIDCYPNCSECESWLNQFGCVTCECSDPITLAGTGTNGGVAGLPTGGGCVFASCEECIAAFPCTGGACVNTQCSLNEFGCPVCQTS